MDKGQRKIVESKKRLLQNQLQVKEQANRLAKDYLPFLEKIPGPVHFEYFTCVSGEQHPLWLNELTKEPWTSNRVKPDDIKQADVFRVHEQVEKHFPGYLPLHYMPCLPFHINEETDFQKVLPPALKSMQVKSDEEVFLFFMRHAPVLRLPLKTVLAIKPGDLPWSEDTCLLSVDFQWFIFKSLEDEWRWGRTPMDNRFFKEEQDVQELNAGKFSHAELPAFLQELTGKLNAAINIAEIKEKLALFQLSGADDFLHVIGQKQEWVEIWMHKNGESIWRHRKGVG